MTMDIKSIVQECKDSNNFDVLVNWVPYARTIGMGCMKAGDEIIFTLPANEDNIGNPTLPAIHGGVLGGFIEQSAILFVLMIAEQPKFPKVVDLSIDYLSAGHYRDSFAQCRALRVGRRLANIQVSAWQDKKEQPIATARANLLL